MIKLAFTGKAVTQEGISLVAEQLDIGVVQPADAELTVDVQENAAPLSAYTLEGKTAVITYGGGYARFFRALAGLCAAYRGEGPAARRETPLFDVNGAMYDVSRDAVARVETVEYLLRSMALMGLNTFMLYTEDTYELPSRPYFGYMRGRYTDEELKRLDAYAIKLGIELIPCIQLLGHLATTLRWQGNADLADTANVLLEGAPQTEAFIRDALAQVKRCFTTRRVHIGMDETHDLGVGKHLDLYGYEPRSVIYFRHLKLVSAIAAEMGLRPMMWSDMFFRLAAQQQKLKNFRDYDRRVELTPDIAAGMPDNVDPVFWDYYVPDEAFYAENLEKHKLFKGETIFAGGIWCWGGFAPQFTRSFRNTLPALDACRKAGTKQVIATVWHNGAECSLILCLPHLALWADYDYTGGYHEAGCAGTLKAATGEDYASLLSAECIEYPEPGNDAHGASRSLIYNDPLIGLSDRHLVGLDTRSYYKQAQKTLADIKTTAATEPAMLVLRKAARLLEGKADYGVRLKAAYDARDREGLQDLAAEARVLRRLVEDMRIAHRDSWMKYNKGFGWEVHDARYGALEMRFDTVCERIRAYLAGEIPVIDELEAERLYFMQPKGGFQLSNDWSGFSSLYTANRL